MAQSERCRSDHLHVLGAVFYKTLPTQPSQWVKAWKHGLLFIQNMFPSGSEGVKKKKTQKAQENSTWTSFFWIWEINLLGAV